ncbi:hypothetical protein Xcab_00285 [Xenorhabdus cabanillasii JM26]|nr:hypothetical protein Xcab_00285 [Xenorhabdus cabanillasii JM26]
MIVVVLGFTAFSVPIGGDACLIIIVEMITPIAAGGGSCEYPSTIIVGEIDICLISIVPAGHPPLCVIFMPQVVMLERFTFMQVALRIIVTGHQPLLFLRFKIIHGLELLALIAQHQPETIGARNFNQLRLFIVNKLNCVLTAVGDRGQFADISDSMIEMVAKLGLAIGQLQFAIQLAGQQGMRNMLVTGEYHVIRRAEIVDYAVGISEIHPTIGQFQLA